jgi:hypothetical protein
MQPIMMFLERAYNLHKGKIYRLEQFFAGHKNIDEIIQEQK